MQVNLVGLTKGKTKTVEVSDVLFNRELNEALVHQVAVAYMARRRAGTHAQKTRSEVRGGGAKPWRQKGSGRARAGTSRSPLWRGGGVTFAAQTQSYAQRVNKKMYKGAICVILSELLRQGKLLVTEKFSVSAPKTRELITNLAQLGLSTNTLIVTKTPEQVEEFDINLFLAARNIPTVDVCDALAIDPISLLSFDKILVTVDALGQFEELLK